MRGLQRGASSFSTSSGVAIVELLSRALHTVQVWRREGKDREEGREGRDGREERWTLMEDLNGRRGVGMGGEERRGVEMGGEGRRGVER